MKRLLTRVLSTASVLAMATTASAQDNPYEIDIANLTMEACTMEIGAMTNVYTSSSTAEFATALHDYAHVRSSLTEDSRASGALEAVRQLKADLRAQRQTQVVYLEFNDADPTFQVFNGVDEETGEPILFGVFPDYIFTEEDKSEIIEQLETTYALYNVRFTDVQPAQGDYSTIQIGANDENPIDLQGGILFGRADNIDFGNDDRNDNAFADGTFWQLIAELDSTRGTQNFQRFLDLPEPLTAEEIEEFRQIAVVNQSANTTAHELGHILGLRHHDSIGAPGDGLPSTGAIQPEDFFPVLETDLNADETTDHVMASGASVGLGLEAPVLFDRFLSERSANKLNLNQGSITRQEENIRNRFVPFAPLFSRFIPNPLVMGENSGKRLLAKRSIIEGSISEIDEVDEYVMFLRDGQVFNSEIISNSDRLKEDFILGTTLTLTKLNWNGTEEVVGVNQRTFEGFEPLLFDITIEGSGLYKVSVEVPDIVTLADGTELSLTELELEEFRTGEYELHSYSVDSVQSRSRRRFAFGW